MHERHRQSDDLTRTQGFWATHPQLAGIAWFGGTAYGHTFPGVVGTSGIGDATLCGRPIDTLGKVMGGFWSDIAKKTTGAKRSSLDQARMQQSASFNTAGDSGQFTPGTSADSKGARSIANKIWWDVLP